MPADTANDNTKDRQSATAADIASVRSEMTKMESDNLAKPETPADMANDKTEGRQQLATAADMAKVKSEMVQMKSVLSKPGTLADMANDNTKERQELATTADMAEVKSEMANIKSGGRMELKAPTDMANIKANNRQQSVTAAEMTDVESEMAKMKANNLAVPGTPAGRPTSSLRSFSTVRSWKRLLVWPRPILQMISYGQAMHGALLRSLYSSDSTESAASALPGTFHLKPNASGRRNFETPAGVAKTQSTNATVRSAKPLPIPAVIELSSDPTENPTPTPPGTPKISSEESQCRQKLEAPASVLDTQSADDDVRSGETSSIPAVIVLSSDPAENPKPTQPDTEERTIEVIVLSSDPPESAFSTPSPLQNSKRLRTKSPDSASKRPRGSPATEGKLQKRAGPS
ncbi:hypothetical protein KC331_g11743 [Hortaea werneckii]|nr:hypothetical protein KC331_g11743 [Hortaea werneckii]KAI7707776.1 hypothetical protein KC353_g11434 [Hortaea werneckii]